MVFTSFEYLLFFLPVACLLITGLAHITPEIWGGGETEFDCYSQSYFLRHLEN